MFGKINLVHSVSAGIKKVRFALIVSMQISVGGIPRILGILITMPPDIV
jgi:hypothetical protein